MYHRRIAKFAGATLIALGFCRSAECSEPIVLEGVVLRPLVEAEVPARQVGVLSRIDATEGAVVEQGQVLATLDGRAAEIAVRKATVERDQAVAKAANDLRIQYADKSLEVARAEVARSAESVAQFAKSISQSQLDVERLTVEKLELERRQAEQDQTLDRLEGQLKTEALDAAKLDLELHQVRAPFPGVVTLVRARLGEWVQPGDKVLRLVQVERLRAEGFVAADKLQGLQAGAPATFVVADDRGATARQATGVVRFVSPEIDPLTRQARLWAEIDNRGGRLRPGDQGQLQIGAAETNRETATAGN
jgi:macrolide-specific efflux system membrane fusion protein